MQSMKNALSGHANITELLLDMVDSNRHCQPIGIYSICSANRFVLEAGMIQALQDETVVCIESTSNQVNQYGGYTGMTPADFREFVRAVAVSMKFPESRVILGGDHLGPHVWQKEPAHSAMAKARELVRCCVLEGYTKIHLDASMRCADDPGDHHTPLDERVVTERAVDLCQTAEIAFSELPVGSTPPVFVIGTEVPIPGGEQTSQSGVPVTSVSDVERTLTLAQASFHKRGLQSAWQRVIAVVVQPGVEFGDSSVFEYNHEKAKQLSAYLEQHWKLVYEAHSTDYQTPGALCQMVKDHFAILKVGPWLTFAMREAIFALECIEKEWSDGKKGLVPSKLREVLQQTMLDHPEYWESYYHGDEDYLRCARDFSYSDRCRYYWPRPQVQEALGQLLHILSEHPIPLTLLSQYLPAQYQAVRNGELRNHPVDLIHHRILEVTDVYARACGMR
jgi:D-tagatose-1,6-bisphosphate aldolase subunit GatZ/KbaZ